MTRPLPVRAAVLTLAMLVCGGCVAPAPNVRRDLNDLKQESYQTRKDLGDNKKAIAALSARMDDLSRNIPREDSMGAIRSSQTALLGRVNDLHEEVQGLMASVEQELNEARKLSRQTAADLDVVKATSQQRAGGDFDKRLAAIELELALIKKKLAVRESTGADAPEAEEPDVKTAEGSAEQEYKAAYELYKSKQFSKARESFTAFIKKNKDHKWAGNAQFWIGETRYSEGDYKGAILSYDDVVRNYPKSNKVPDSMLKQGYSFLQLKDPLAAKGVLSGLVRKYPDSRAAGLAREKLKTLD